jgi:hypothetical protein
MCPAEVYITVRGCILYIDLQMDCLHFTRSVNCHQEECAWYREHFGAFELSASTTTEVGLIELGNVEDPYPLVEYMVGGLRMVTLKDLSLSKVSATV